ncbi:hypothetical protein PKOR_17100 [Pontibacter korlensis]|uniref:Uncharacterized protein n=1 Tax=Pontibacter korlensis TaxID=400092 RepID=A0A0E3ZFQ6_9BACT|nr:hypothetical protein PKOR_17100 [Pontibacter korlensis]
MAKNKRKKHQAFYLNIKETKVAINKFKTHYLKNSVGSAGFQCKQDKKKRHNYRRLFSRS